MGRKGISPLVASVLLLAVTLSIASIFSGWGPNLIETITESTENQTERTVECNDAGVEILSAEYFNGDGETSIVIRNTGAVDLDNIQASAWRNNLPVDDTTASIGRGNFTTVNVTTPDKPDYVRAESRECTSVWNEYEDIG